MPFSKGKDSSPRAQGSFIVNCAICVTYRGLKLHHSHHLSCEESQISLSVKILNTLQYGQTSAVISHIKRIISLMISKVRWINPAPNSDSCLITIRLLFNLSALTPNFLVSFSIFPYISCLFVLGSKTTWTELNSSTPPVHDLLW